MTTFVRLLRPFVTRSQIAVVRSVLRRSRNAQFREPMKMRPTTSVASKYPRLFAIVDFSSRLLTVSLLMASACGGGAASNSNATLPPVITVDEAAAARSRPLRPVGNPRRFVITICAMTVGSNTPLPECTGETPQTPCATDDGWIFSGGDQVQFGLLLEGACTVVAPDGPETIRRWQKIAISHIDPAPRF
jgi:hypothetical protein